MGKIVFKMPDNSHLDVGLNLINRKDNLLLPGVVRCNFG